MHTTWQEAVLENKQEYLEEIELGVEKIPIAGCWLWTHYLDDHEYGAIFVHGYRDIGIHRVSYVVHKGTYPPDLWVLHKCDVRFCINPEHLYIGNHAQNTRDMMERGRGPKNHIGSINPKAKLVESQVREIKRLVKETDRTYQNIADQFGCSKQTVVHIIMGRQWKHVVD